MLIGAAVLLLATASHLSAQTSVTGRVVDESGAPIAGARVTAIGATAETLTAPDGFFALDLSGPAATLLVTAVGFADRLVTATIESTLPLSVILLRRGITESVVVSAEAPVRLASPASATVLDHEAIAAAPALALDDRLRSLPGFSLFRRSSGRVANPTTQGVTLRGLAASGASRATVVSDGVPLTDPFGGWVQWGRLPTAAVERVTVTRGGASDLYGADAVGGAIVVDTARAGARLQLDGGTQGTARASMFGGRTRGRNGVRGGAEWFTTDGFVVVAPDARGPVDTPASSRHVSLLGGAAFGMPRRVEADLQAGYFDEDRDNGTPFQENATIVRHGAGRVSGAFGGTFIVGRVFGASQDYSQTFSAIAADRESEQPTRAQRVEASTAGFAADVVLPWRGSATLVGVAFQEVRAALEDRSLVAPGAAADTTEATQRTAAVIAQLSMPPRPTWSLSAGVRVEGVTSGREREPRTSVVNVAPRAAIVVQVTPSVSLRGALQSGYRFPTINELYRDFRVGNVITRANPALDGEEAFGFEGSLFARQSQVTARISGFWNRVQDAIVNATIADDGAVIVRERRNAATIRARGVEAEADAHLGRFVSVTAGVAFIDSTFVEGADLEGLDVPQVPGVHASAGLTVTLPRGQAAVEWRGLGRQFDDDRNRFELERTWSVDARAAWRVRRGVEVFAAIENAFDVEQDVGRTPVRTIGLPRTTRAGLRLLR